jgi:urea carboxylase-associated protein 2
LHRKVAIKPIACCYLVQHRDRLRCNMGWLQLIPSTTDWYGNCNGCEMTNNESERVGRMLWDEDLRADSHWSGVIRRGISLRLTALGSDANVAALFYSSERLIERYNMADTLKAQHTAFLTAGCVCYSDMGRVLCALTADTCGWHDTICGLSDAALIADRFGNTRFQEQRNERHCNGRDAMLNELGKYGLDRRDLVANINFFSKVTTDESGSLQWSPGHSVTGDYVELRFEMDTLAIFYAGVHPLSAATVTAQPSRISAWYSGPAPTVDACRNRCPENQRGYRNTEMMCLT